MVRKRAGGGARRRWSSLERAHYRVFAVFARYLDAAGLSLADIVRPEAEAEAGAGAEPPKPT